MSGFKIAVAGCGGMANQWVKYALSREDAQIVALVDINAEASQAMAERHGLSCGRYENVEEALRETGAVLLFDVTIPAAHRQVVSSALRLGCDVFGEKPMAASLREAEEMTAEAVSFGRRYAVMQNRRFLKQIRAFRDLLTRGTVGQTGFVTANFFLGPHFGGFREAMDSPLILDMAIHTFDQARFLIGADPVSVYCHEFNPAGSWYKGSAAAACIFEFSDGTVFSYNGSWCAEGVPTSWEAEWRVVGSRGTAVWNGAEAPFAEVASSDVQEGLFKRGGQRIEAASEWSGREGHYGCLDEMFASLIEGRPAETECTDNIKSMAMVFGALESAETGRKVELRRY